MLWSEIRTSYPDKWLIVEALEAYTAVDKQRQLTNLAVIECCSDGKAAIQRYRALHRQYPTREFYFLHTSRAEPDIHERWWLGIRSNHAADTDR